MLCKCGCGQDAGVYHRSRTSDGTVKGTPKKFIQGHVGVSNKTHCIRGHEFTPENTRLTLQDGYRVRICKECKRNWVKANPETRRETVRKYEEANYDKVRAQHSAWGKSHREVTRGYWRRYKAHKVINGGSFTVAQWVALQILYECKCVGCGRSEVQLRSLGLKLVPDHVHAVSKGGSNDISNIQPLCHGNDGCNNHKGAKYIDYRPGFPLEVA